MIDAAFLAAEFTSRRMRIEHEYAMEKAMLLVQKHENEIAALGMCPSAQLAPTKCPSCGSREFRQHHDRCICAYCRSGA